MTETLSAASLHQERVFEQHIVQTLVNHQDYLERDCATHYDAPPVSG